MNPALRSSFLPVFALLCLLSGCAAAKGPDSYPVRGKVSFQGKPLAEAYVVLHRVGGDVEGNQKPIAYTAADGSFVVSTFQSGDGAPPGEYAITVELRAPRTVGEEVVRDGPNLLPPKYASPRTTDLKFTVGAGENEIPPISLKG